MKTILFTFSLLVTSLFISQNSDLLYSFDNAIVTFVSDAPLEDITASTSQIKGLVNFTDNTFAIAVEMQSFQGFNSLLQKEHFDENYVESFKFPNSFYKGKIIEPINIKVNGEYKIRTKGILELHGISKEQIIPVILKIDSGKIFIEADFSLNLNDYEISIPRIVSQKISENIEVRINAELSLYQPTEN